MDAVFRADKYPCRVLNTCSPSARSINAESHLQQTKKGQIREDTFIRSFIWKAYSLAVHHTDFDHYSGAKEFFVAEYLVHGSRFLGVPAAALAAGGFGGCVKEQKNMQKASDRRELLADALPRFHCGSS